MKITSETLEALRVGFKTSFQGGLGMAQSQWPSVATEVPSDSREETYGWLGKLPRVREWVGDRLIQNLMEHGYAIRNRPWELTIGVDRDDIEDDKLKTYGPLFTEMGQSTGAHADELVLGLLKDGWATKCYDGKPFFSTLHPVIGGDEKPAAVANTDNGSGAPWFLMSTGRVLKPLIYQLRKNWQFVSKDAPTDEAVFSRKQFVYGADARANVGFGFWQMCWGSKQPLDSAYYKVARAALMNMKGDHGRALGIVPDLLVVPPSLEGEAMEILNAERDAAGATNIWRGTAKLLVSPWLA